MKQEIIGIVWYASEADFVRETRAVEGDSPHYSSYAEWKSDMLKTMRRLQRDPSKLPVKVPLNADEFFEFCSQSNRQVDEAARMAFLEYKLTLKFGKNPSRRARSVRGKQGRPRPERSVLGIWWYKSAEDFVALRAIWEGQPDDWNRDYEDWKEEWEPRFRAHQADGGYTAVKVPLVIDELVRFCRSRGYRIDSTGRDAYVRHILDKDFS